MLDSMILNGISHINVRATQNGKLCLLNVDIQMVGAELLVCTSGLVNHYCNHMTKTVP